MTGPKLAAPIAALPPTVPFVGAEVIERKRGKPFAARIGANESGFGPSPKVIKAIADAAPGIWTYGDSEVFELRHALSRHLGIDIEALCVGEGIDALLGLVSRLYLDPGDRVVTSLGAYPTFNYHVAAQGAELVKVPYRNDKEDLSGLIDAVLQSETKIVYLANPDNPMGTWWDSEIVIDFIDQIPAETMIVLDEAYGETAPSGTMPPVDIMHPNLLRFRTFSKAYGLAGLRVGYVFGAPDTVAGFNRIRNHFGVTKISQIAALTALGDQRYLEQAIADIGAARDKIMRFSKDLGLAPIPSATNFVTIDCGRDEAFADAVLDALIARDIFVRKPQAPGLGRCIRLSAAPDRDLDLAASALADALDEMRTKV